MTSSPDASRSSRRAFIAASSAAAAGLALGLSTRPVFARTAWKSGLENPVLGSGEHRYECIHDWLTPPEGLAWGDTHGLAQDEAGRIYVAHTVHASSTKHDAVLVFGPDGKFITAWGAAFKGGAHGLDVRREGDAEFLYHCDTARRIIVKTDLKGETVWTAEWPKESGKYETKEKYCPTNVAFLPGGDFLVGDGYGSSFIHRYSAAGKYLKTIAGPGSGAGQVSCPHGLWLETRGKVMPDGLIVKTQSNEQIAPAIAVADRGNRRIQYLTQDGQHIAFVNAGIRMPCHFKTRGDLLLVPDLESVITLLGPDNKPIAHLGDGAKDGKPSSLRGAARKDFVPGKFIHPHTAIFLNNGDILVAEWVPIGRVTLLRRVS